MTLTLIIVPSLNVKYIAGCSSKPWPLGVTLALNCDTRGATISTRLQLSFGFSIFDFRATTTSSLLLLVVVVLAVLGRFKLIYSEWNIKRLLTQYKLLSVGHGNLLPLVECIYTLKFFV